jgi:hypothetical protein
MKFNFCCICGITDSLHHHHIIPVSKGGSDEETNIITLCNKHHAWIHGLKPTAWNNHANLVREGLENARKKGRIGGRPTNLTDEVRSKIVEMKGAGVPIRKIRNECPVGTSTIYKVIRDML